MGLSAAKGQVSPTFKPAHIMYYLGGLIAMSAGLLKGFFQTGLLQNRIGRMPRFDFAIHWKPKVRNG